MSRPFLWWGPALGRQDAECQTPISSTLSEGSQDLLVSCRSHANTNTTRHTCRSVLASLDLLSRNLEKNTKHVLQKEGD